MLFRRIAGRLRVCTFRLQDLSLGRNVALKFTSAARLSDEASRERFLREARSDRLGLSDLQ
jgi:hypothetical protein